MAAAKRSIGPPVDLASPLCRGAALRNPMQILRSSSCPSPLSRIYIYD